jgi:hypothetical protein
MSKFKVGDRVFVSNPLHGYECQKDFKFVVDEVEFNENQDYSYRGKGVDSEGTISSGWYYGEEELSLDTTVSSNRYEYSLLQYCESVHMFCTGASDSDVEEQYRAIKARLDDWQPSPRISAKYDQIVKNLCERVVVEYEISKK